MQTSPSPLFSQSAGHRKLLEQYDSEQGLQFYQHFMGEFNIHYGIYQTPYDSIIDASKNTIKFMADLILQRGYLGSENCIVDLGSGTGGAAHYLALTYGCQVTCVNLCPNQNRQNKLRSEELGISHLIKIVECSFDNLPQEWENSFEIVWSEEAFCHASNQQKVIQEAQRILQPGGVLIFTDIMRGSTANEKELNTFTAKNAVTNLVSVSNYIDWISQAEFINFEYYDLSANLGINFQKMIAQIDRFKAQMLEKGVDEKYISEFRQSLVNRLKAYQKNIFAWGCFYMNKPPSIPSSELKILTAGRKMISISIDELTQKNVGDLGTVFPM